MAGDLLAAPWPAFAAHHREAFRPRGGQGRATSLVRVVLMALDVLIDGLPDQVGHITVLSLGDLFEPAPLIFSKAQAVAVGKGHWLRSSSCVALDCSVMQRSALRYELAGGLTCGLRARR